MYVCVGAAHVEQPKDVDSKLLNKIRRSDEKMRKRTIKMITQLNRQDLNIKAVKETFGRTID